MQPRGDKLRVHWQIHPPAQHLAALGLGGIRSIIHVLKYRGSAEEILHKRGLD
jgi:hypothetical protein